MVYQPSPVRGRVFYTQLRAGQFLSKVLSGARGGGLFGELVLRKPDDRAPADTSTLPKALDAIGSKHPPLGVLCTYPAPKMCGARSRPRLHEGSIDLTGVGLDFDEAPSRLPLLL